MFLQHLLASSNASNLVQSKILSTGTVLCVLMNSMTKSNHLNSYGTISNLKGNVPSYIFDNFMGKGKNVGNKHFLHFHNVFHP